MLAITDTQAITFAVVVVIVVGAIAALIRVVLNRQDPTWRGIKIGFFIERERTHKIKQDASEQDTFDWSERAP